MSVTTNITVDVNISPAIKQIKDVLNDEFSEEYKKELEDYLISLERVKATKDKSTILNKIKPV